MRSYLQFLNESDGTNRFQIGDFVVGVGKVDSTTLTGHRGIIVAGGHSGYQYGVDFGSKFRGPGHNLYGKISTPTGYWVYDKNLELDPEYSDKMKKGLMERIIKSPTIENLVFDFMYSCYSEYNYVDITDKNDTISYLTTKKSKLVPEEEKWTSKMRQPMKIGRFLQTVYGYKGSDLENYVNLYKFRYDLLKGKHQIELVSGEDIRFWYDGDNYVDAGGTLNNSCMRDEEDQYRFDIYCENPDKIRLAILKTDNNKLAGRALVWKLDGPKNKIFMDRVYTIDDFLVHIFDDYCQKQGWENQQFGLNNNCYVELGRDYGSDDENPYMDTMRYFKHDNFTLHSQSPSGNYSIYNDY